ncbi:alpha/beta hydrolase [Amycolatopsis speibonae]|uniref:Alpha/beta hydrolase n=1 Tax=Amycolatopsis speibonae TaxID=1450224 RepID=A0ABV7NXI7_9PSEU
MPFHDRAYWDWPFQPRRYSYVDSATRPGYATLNLDRLGYGRSSRPDPETLDFAAGGEAVHQVVAQLRPRFRTIVLNGHSMGGLVAERAAERGGVDAVIISGIPRDRPGGQAKAASPFYPAELDPKFAGKPWAAGYFTTRPGTRAQTFHHPGTYDPAILPVEEALKDTLAYVLGEHVRWSAGTATAAPTKHWRRIGGLSPGGADLTPPGPRCEPKRGRVRGPTTRKGCIAGLARSTGRRIPSERAARPGPARRVLPNGP